jgi:putative transposase
METIYKAFKYRIYPNQEQTILINKHIGSCRWLYNYALNKKVEAYKKDKTKLNRFDLSADLPILKKNEETQWLKEVNSQSLQMSLKNMDEAFTKFFRDKRGFPKFKSKHNSKQSFNIPQNIKVDWESKKISVPKIQDIKFSLDRIADGDIKSATISKTPTNKYFISILVDTKNKEPKKFQIKEENAIGIDLGIKDFAITSNGEKFENPKNLRKHLEKLQKLQKRASKKQKGSENKRKANLKVALLHEKISNARNDFLHKLSTKLISENQTICLEDLSVENMIKNHKLALSIQDCSWSKFNEYLEYKAIWNGNNIIRIGRFEPSSKMCSNCGKINNELSLKDRTWKCEGCGFIHDRDINAGINIKDFALHENNLIGAGRPKFKPLENTSLEGSAKEETHGSIALG